MRTTPYPKKIDYREKVYYHFKIDATNYALFDSEMNTATAYGSYNLVASIISTLPKSVTIFYFEIDKREGWRMKRSYNPEKKTVSDEKRKQDVEDTEKKKAAILGG